MFSTNRLAKFLETGEMPLVTALDEAIENYNPKDLEKHDKRFHPEGYKEGDACKYREGMAEGDKTDEGLGGDKEQANPVATNADRQKRWETAFTKFRELLRKYDKEMPNKTVEERKVILARAHKEAGDEEILKEWLDAD